MKKVKLLSAKQVRKIELAQINQEILEAIDVHETEILVPNLSKRIVKQLKKKGFSVRYLFDCGEFYTIISWKKKEKIKKGAIKYPNHEDFKDIDDYFLGFDNNSDDGENY